MKRFLVPIVLGCCSFLGGLAAVQLGRFVPAAWAQPASGSTEVSRLEERFEAVAHQVGPMIVSIESVKTVSKDGKQKQVEESGSGILFRPDPRRGTFVLTNNHVIAQAEARSITVSLADDRIFTAAQVGPTPNRTWRCCGSKAATTCRPPFWATAIRCALANGCWPSAARSA